MYKLKNLANLEYEKHQLKSLKVVDKPETMAAFNEKHQKHLNLILCQNKHDPFLQGKYEAFKKKERTRGRSEMSRLQSNLNSKIANKASDGKRLSQGSFGDTMKELDLVRKSNNNSQMISG